MKSVLKLLAIAWIVFGFIAALWVLSMPIWYVVFLIAAIAFVFAISERK